MYSLAFWHREVDQQRSQQTINIHLTKLQNSTLSNKCVNKSYPPLTFCVRNGVEHVQSWFVVIYFSLLPVFLCQLLTWKDKKLFVFYVSSLVWLFTHFFAESSWVSLHCMAPVDCWCFTDMAHVLKFKKKKKRLWTCIFILKANIGSVFIC